MIKLALTAAELNIIAQRHWLALQRPPYELSTRLQTFGRRRVPAGVLVSHRAFVGLLHANLEKLVAGRPATLQRLAGKLNPAYQQVRQAIEAIGPPSSVPQRWTTYAASLAQVFNYQKFVRSRTYGAYNLAAALAINVCPYCNRQYTFTLDGLTGRVRPEFDHFLDQATYPYLALSLCNLVPSCHICNSNLKGSQHFDHRRYLNPYAAGFGQVLRFSLDITSIDFVNGQRGSFTLRYRPALGARPHLVSKAQANALVFKHLELYSNHEDLLIELLKKAYYYTPARQRSLAAIQKPDGTSLFADVHEVRRLITGVYTEEADHGRRPMSKLITDIAAELGLLP